MNRTPIEWTDWSVNPFKMRMPDGTLINVCLHKSDGCRFCYAEGIVRRWWKKEWGEFPGYTAALLKLGTPVLVEEELQAVLRLSKRIAAGKADPEANKIFWNDMTDEYLDFWSNQFIDQCFQVRYDTPNLIHQVLTKRPERLLDYISRSAYLSNAPLENVWLGTSVEDQKTADERIPLLLETPAAVHWISAEPLLGPVDLRNLRNGTYNALDGIDYEDIGDIRDAGILGKNDLPGLDWIVVGGESGPTARPMHPDWARSLRDQCVAASVPFFFKQWGEWKELGHDEDGPEMHEVERGTELCEATAPLCDGFLSLNGHFVKNLRDAQANVHYRGLERVGKKTAGRMLDGREWSEFPEAARAATA